jgi:2-oxoglutarate ferredoxin oxidoreductase subunit beta
MSPLESPRKLTRKDFASDQDVRWCPGCGDYAILATMQRTLPELGVTPENTVFVSGIGCSSRFPYYMATYGFHTIHGRAPAIATGVKLANPELDVWVITGDGDALSIGGNHTLHMLRRNVGLKVLLFNNRIYGLTKGQYSPTSIVGIRTPSTPMGSVDMPIVPCSLALGANGRFVARAIDTDGKGLGELFRRAHAHKGTTFIEILQNCPVFNDGAWEHVTEKSKAAENQLMLVHGKPMTFAGADGTTRGLRLDPQRLALEVVTVGEGGVTEADLLVHDETNRTMAFMLSAMEPPEFPIALGVLFAEAAPSYESAVLAQVAQAKGKGLGDLDRLLRSGHTWTVGAGSGG